MSEFFDFVKGECIGELKSKKFCSSAFLRSSDKAAEIPLPFKSEEEKRMMINNVGSLCVLLNADEVIIAMDVYLRKVLKEDFEYVKENRETEMPSAYPSEMREEALTFLCISKEEQSMELVVLQYKPNGDDDVVFYPEQRDNDCIEGGIVDCFKEGVSRGIELIKRSTE